MFFDPTVTPGNVIAFLSLLFSFSVGWFSWRNARRSNVDSQLKEVSDRVFAQESRLNSVEQTINILPTKDDLHKIDLGLAEVNGTMARVEAVMGGNQMIMRRLENIVSRHEDHLLNNK